MMTEMKLERWMLNKPIDVFFFDCDSTLSLMEGIDELAQMQGVGARVKEMTRQCMGITGLSKEYYKHRLELVKPTRDQMDQAAKLYSEYQTPGALEVIQLLHFLGKKVYILSAGITSSILPFARELGIPKERVLAVDVYFDEEGEYRGFDEDNLLIHFEGKNRQIEKVLGPGERSFLIGDGLSDWEARTAVTRFVGFGGENPKPSVKDHSDIYINAPSLFSVINLGLTYEEQMNLPLEYRHNYDKGLADILNGLVLMRWPSNLVTHNI